MRLRIEGSVNWSAVARWFYRVVYGHKFNCNFNPMVGSRGCSCNGNNRVIRYIISEVQTAASPKSKKKKIKIANNINYRD
ncbi:hypothetical protein ACH5RR_040656 [Cinchona calisaya]|uniref:Uncharacterized protein n=1 Tax=Cinchona calisaya TaxID=153742 RepID=A0ABD2XS70_9GENT